jgi:glutamyl-tRNA synthetase
MLARLGTSLPVEPIADRKELLDSFALDTFGRAPARFDDAELERINAAIVHRMDYASVRDRVPSGMDAAGWHAIRPNLSHVGEAGEWWHLVTGPIDPPEFGPEDRHYLARAAQALEWSDDPWLILTDKLKRETGRKGRALFLPLRQALTGMDHGPDMKELLPLIGENETRARLEQAAKG